MLYAVASPRGSVRRLRRRKDASPWRARPKCCCRSPARRARKPRLRGRRGDGRRRVSLLRVPTKLQTLQRVVTALVVLGAVTLVSATVNAEDIDFGQINKFESLA